MEKFKFLEHTADIKFRAFGEVVEKVFENSALALKEAIVGKIKIKNKIKKSFCVEGRDDVSALYNFLEEFLYLLDAEDFILSKVEVKKVARQFKASVLGDKASNYKFSNPVKAVTYNDMFVEEKNNKWVAQVVLDV